MNLKLVWSGLHLISIRSQNLLAFTTAVEAFVNRATCIVQCQQPFHIFSIRCQSIEKLHRKYRSCKAKRTGSASPPRFVILNSFKCSSNTLSVTSEEVLLEINNFLQDVHFLWLSIRRGDVAAHIVTYCNICLGNVLQSHIGKNYLQPIVVLFHINMI